MDKLKLAKLITAGTVEAVAISSTASKSEKDRLLREFMKKVGRMGDGELVLVVAQK